MGLTQTAVFAGGCFWCTEAIFQKIEGVIKIESGYTGGTSPNPTYKQVCTGNTGYAEAVKIIYDPTKVSYEKLLDIFFDTHDYTTLNRQGNDFGTQYRSAIFYENEDQYKLALRKIANLGASVVTTLEPLGEFYRAEDYHQNFYNNNRNYPYCRIVIDPKLKRLMQS